MVLELQHRPARSYPSGFLATSLLRAMGFRHPVLDTVRCIPFDLIGSRPGYSAVPSELTDAPSGDTKNRPVGDTSKPAS